jgi:hypothetical protein
MSILGHIDPIAAGALTPVDHQHPSSSARAADVAAVAPVSPEDLEVVALDPQSLPTMHDVTRRRIQVAFVAGMVAVTTLVAALAAVDVIDVDDQGILDIDTMRLPVLALAVGIVVYCVHQDLSLRKVVRQRHRLETLEQGVASSLLSSGILLDAVRAMAPHLELSALLPEVVEQGRALVGAERGAVYLTEGQRAMEPVVDADGIGDAGTPIADLVVTRRGVVGVVDGDAIDVGVPLVAGGAVIAVLVLPGVLARELTDDLSDLLTRFGEAAGTAIANARRYEAAMFLLDSPGHTAQG